MLVHSHLSAVLAWACESARHCITHSGITKHYALEVVTNLYKFLPGGAALQKAKFVGQKMNLIAETPVTPRCSLCRPCLVVHTAVPAGDLAWVRTMLRLLCNFRYLLDVGFKGSIAQKADKSVVASITGLVTKPVRGLREDVRRCAALSALSGGCWHSRSQGIA